MLLEINDGEDCTIIKFNTHKLLGTEGVEFQNSIVNTLDKGVKSIAVDLSSIEYVTSWGIGMLVHAFTTCTNREANYSLIGVNKRVKDIFRIIKIDTILPIHDSV